MTTAVAAAGMCLARPAVTQEPSQARLEQEFAQAVQAAVPLAEAVRGDTALFRALVRPFGRRDAVGISG